MSTQYKVFSDETYVGENLRRAQVFPYLTDTSIIDCDMRKFHMGTRGHDHMTSVIRCVFERTPLVDGMFVRCGIIETQFIDCDMRQVYMHHGSVENTAFMGTKHSSSSVSGTHFTSCLFWGADLKRLRVARGADAQFLACRFVGCNLPALEPVRFRERGSHTRYVRRRRGDVPSLVFSQCVFEDAGEIDWRPDEVLPEDFYVQNCLRRRSLV